MLSMVELFYINMLVARMEQRDDTENDMQTASQNQTVLNKNVRHFNLIVLKKTSPKGGITELLGQGWNTLAAQHTI